jgi:hypothetical protein
MAKEKEMIKQKFSNALAKTRSLVTEKWGKSVAIAALVLGIAGGSIAGYSWYKNHVWPSFPAAQDQADPATPQALIVLGRDYAYRTGDLVEVKLYLKQKPGTVVDCQTLAINDTFELAQKPVVRQKLLKDGSTVYSIDLTLQSFKVELDHTLTGSVSWKNGSQRNELTLPETHIFWSNTYDGRKKLMEGGDPRVSIYWYGTRYVLPMLLAGIVWLLLLLPAIKAWRRSRIKPVVIDHARLRTVKILEKFKAGAISKEEHLELDGLVRDRFKIGPVPASQLEMAIVPPTLIAFLKLNETAIYSQEDLDDKAQAQLFAKGQTVLSRWK